MKKGAVASIFKQKAVDDACSSVPVSKKPRSAYVKREQRRVSLTSTHVWIIQNLSNKDCNKYDGNQWGIRD